MLLDHIRSGRFSYRGVDVLGRPIPWTPTWPDGRLLPLLVRIELQPQGNDAWPLMEIPLRVNPLISGMPAGLPPPDSRPGEGGP